MLKNIWVLKGVVKKGNNDRKVVLNMNNINSRNAKNIYNGGIYVKEDQSRSFKRNDDF